MDEVVLRAIGVSCSRAAAEWRDRWVIMGGMPWSEPDPLQAAADLLLDRLPTLSAEVTQEVWAGVPTYSAVLLSREELVRYVKGNLRMVFTALSEGTAIIEDLTSPREMGRNRALQGVPVESLMRSYRTAERATVEVFTRCFTRFSDDLSLHRAGVQRLQKAFDQIETASLDAYRATQLELALPQSASSGSLVGRLASGEAFDPSELESIAQSFGVNPAAPHVAIAARALTAEGAEAVGPIRHHLTSRLLEVVQRPILTGQVADALLFLVPVGESSPLAVEQALNRALTPTQCRHEVVMTMGTLRTGLADVGVSCRQAMDCLDVVTRAGYRRQVVPYENVLVEVMLAGSRDVAGMLVEQVLGPLLSHPHLLSTLETYLDSRQSTAITAQALVVHNNTVAYRLRRAMLLTDRDLQDTTDVVYLYLALKARGIVDPLGRLT